MKKTLNNIGISALVIIVFVACALFSTLCSSCQSQSGKLDKIQPEKVVVLDMFIKMNTNISYSLQTLLSLRRQHQEL